MTLPTLVQNSYTSFVRDHGRYEEEGRGWNARETTIIATTKQFLERSFSVKVRVKELEGLLGPEDVDVDLRRILKEARDERGRKNHEVSPRYVMKHATFGGSNIFQLFDTSEKPNHLVASRRRWLESQGRDDARQENGRNEWYDLGYQGAKAKAPPCSNSTLQTPLPQQSSSSAREEENHWEVMEERRRRRIAFENLAKGMLRYLDI